MDLGDVMDEVAVRLRVITTLTGRTFAYPPPKLTPPGAVVNYPDQINFDETYGRGSDRMTLPVVIVVGKVSDRAARDDIAAYCDGAGARSIKAVIESGTYAAFHSVRVMNIEIDVVSIAGVDYLAAVFDLDIFGTGS